MGEVRINDINLWEAVHIAKENDPHFSRLWLTTAGHDMSSTQMHYGLLNEDARDDEMFIKELRVSGDVVKDFEKKTHPDNFKVFEDFEVIWFFDGTDTVFYINTVSLEGEKLEDRLGQIKEALTK